MADPPLDFGYAFAEPASVLVTVDDSQPVENTLTLVVTNRSGAAVEFQNPELLTPSSPDLPKPDDESSTLGRISVWFPWGDGSGDLSTAADSLSIDAGNATGGWSVSGRQSDPEIGVFWLLLPTSTSVFFDRDASISVQFSQIVSRVGTGGTLPEQSWMTALPKLPAHTTEQGQAAIWKYQLSATLTAPASAIPGEQLELSWRTPGASYCSLEPGGYDNLHPDASQTVTMPEQQSVTYRLTAHPPAGAPVTAGQTVTADTGWVDLGAFPGWTGNDDLLALDVKSGFIGMWTSGTGAWILRDGSGWAPAGTLAEYHHALAGASDGEQAWVLGPRRQQQVYATADGSAWRLVDGGPPWSPYGYAAAAFGGRLWVLGGYTGFSPQTWSTAVWSSSDGGATWSAEPAGPWAATRDGVPTRGGAARFDGRLWTLSANGDVWSTADGGSWKQAPPFPWPAGGAAALAGSDHTLFAVTYGSLWNPLPTKLWQATAGAEQWTPIDVPDTVGGECFGSGMNGFGTYRDGVLVLGQHAWRWVPPLPDPSGLV